MTAFGVTPTGFVSKTQQEILSEEIADATSLISPTLDLSPVAPLGQLLAIEAEKTAEVWELAQVGYNATNRGAAEGAQLDNIGALIGVKRLPATYSTVYCGAAFTVAGTYGAGTLVGFINGQSGQQASNLFAVVVPVTNPGNGLPVSPTNPYVTGSSYAPATLFQSLVIGPNFGNALVAANAGLSGHVGAFTGQVPVAGWLSVVDLNTPTIGQAVETDTAYRVRQVQELGAQGSCNLAAIAVDIINALEAAPSPVTAAVTVYENTGSTTDANGLPPNTFQVIVFDGISPNTAQDDPIIGQQIWNNKPVGIATFGSTSVTVLDSQGTQRTVFFTRPTQTPIYMVVNAAIQSTASPAAVSSLIQQAIIAASQGQPFTAYGTTVTPVAGAPTTLLPGVDVVGPAFAGVAQAQTGVVDVTSVFVGTAPNPTQQVQKIGRNFIGILSQVNLTINLTVFTP